MNTIEQFEAGGSHHEVGLAIGSHFADAIHRFFNSHARLQQQLLPFYYTSNRRNNILVLLSDQTDQDYPIYRDATLPDVDATLCSALYDLAGRELRIYYDHPVKEPEKYVKFSL